MTNLIKLSCPSYEFSPTLDLSAVGDEIDQALIENFKGLKVVIRGVQSGKHIKPKAKLVQDIYQTGGDRSEVESPSEVKVSDRPIDFFGYARIIDSLPIALPILEGFHKWKPKSLEKPQYRVDIWMVYDAEQLDNVEYIHKLYGVKSNDGYRFKNPNQKNSALLGVLVID